MRLDGWHRNCGTGNTVAYNECKKESWLHFTIRFLLIRVFGVASPVVVVGGEVIGLIRLECGNERKFDVSTAKPILKLKLLVLCAFPSVAILEHHSRPFGWPAGRMAFDER